MQRNPSWSAGALGVIVFTTIIYQLTGFMIWTAGNPIGVVLIVTVASTLLVNILNASKEATSMAMAILAVTIMFTPFYYLAIALITAAAATGDDRRMWPLSITYIITLAPLIILENGLTSTGTTSNGPMVFTQLLNLGKNMRPPLASLNVFLPDATTSTYLDAATAHPMLDYLSGTRVFELIIPLTTFALIFSIAATTAGLTNRALKRLADADDNKLLRNIAPLITSIVTPITFATLLNTLSQHNLAGYQTSLQPAETLYMILGSLATGASYAAKEHATKTLERKEIERNRLKNAIEKLRGIIEEDRRLIIEIQGRAPSIDLTKEALEVNEAASTCKDIEDGADNSEIQAIEKWREQIEETTHRLNNTPKRIRLKIITEINRLTDETRTYNESVRDAGITTAFRQTSVANLDTPLEQAITHYTRLTRIVKEDVKRLYARYCEAKQAYCILTSRPDTQPAIDPEALLESNKEKAALRLVAEEYWLRYHNDTKQELACDAARLVESAHELQKHVKSAILLKTLKTFEDPKPANTPEILAAIRALKTIIDETASGIERDNERLGETLKEVSPLATELLGVTATQQKQAVKQLKERNRELDPTILDTAKLLEETSILLLTHSEERRRSDEYLITAAHYPTAQKLIDEKIGTHNTVHMKELPFVDAAARVYAQLYTHSKPDTEYDEDAEEVRSRYV